MYDVLKRLCRSVLKLNTEWPTLLLKLNRIHLTCNLRRYQSMYILDLRALRCILFRGALQTKYRTTYLVIGLLGCALQVKSTMTLSENQTNGWKLWVVQKMLPMRNVTDGGVKRIVEQFHTFSHRELLSPDHKPP